jgi:hypothetical protein
MRREKLKSGASWRAARPKRKRNTSWILDRERADFIQKYFHVEGPDRAVYNAMINTAIGDEAVAHTIPDVMKTLDAKNAV